MSAGDAQPEPDEAMRARVRESIARQGMMNTLGVELIAVERGRVELVLRHDQRFTQQHGFLHAGAVAATLDSACGYAAYTVMAPGADVLTVTFTINLLAPAAGDRFDAVTVGGVSGAVLRAANRPDTHEPKEPASDLSPVELGAGALPAGTAPDCNALDVSGATLFGAAK